MVIFELAFAFEREECARRITSRPDARPTFFREGGVEQEQEQEQKQNQEEEEEEEGLSLFVIVTNEDPPNAHHAQHRPVQVTGAMSA